MLIHGLVAVKLCVKDIYTVSSYLFFGTLCWTVLQWNSDVLCRPLVSVVFSFLIQNGDMLFGSHGALFLFCRSCLELGYCLWGLVWYVSCLCSSYTSLCQKQRDSLLRKLKPNVSKPSAQQIFILPQCPEQCFASDARDNYHHIYKTLVFKNLCNNLLCSPQWML